MRGGLTASAQLAPLAGLERLNAVERPPVAIALSGGGDSLALLHLAKAWADRAGRRLIALTVDHGLQAAGAAWSRFAAERAGAARACRTARCPGWATSRPPACPPRLAPPATPCWPRRPGRPERG